MSQLKATLEQIAALLNQADNLYRSLPNSVTEAIHGIHNEAHTLDHCLRWGVQAAEECLEQVSDKPIYGYYINLDERGEFYADVRNALGSTVYEIHAGDPEEGSIFEDGFMRHKHDVEGLTDYLRDLDIIPKTGTVLHSSEFETKIDMSDETHGLNKPTEPLLPGTRIRTEDGYTLTIQDDGSLTDGDITFTSIADLDVDFTILKPTPAKTPGMG